MPTGDLKIRRLNWQKHMGLYKCRAENVIGHETVVDETSTFLYPVVVSFIIRDLMDDVIFNSLFLNAAWWELDWKMKW